MVCQNCEQGIVAVVEQSGGIEEGPFTEIHKCNYCGATGTIRGRAEKPPREWERTGAVFNG